jgi:hypothetical protein
VNWFEKWSEHHAATFGLLSPDDGKMLKAWQDIFDAEGLTHSELTDATKHLATNDTPRFRIDHLQKIQVFVRGRRTELAKANREAQEQRAGFVPCSRCQGTGFVLVPTLRFVVDGTWTAYGKTFMTNTVSCLCLRGEDIRDKAAKYKAAHPEKKTPAIPLRLADYELRNPNWEFQMEQRAAQEKAEREAKRLAQVADAQPMAPLFERLIAKAKGAR